MANHEYGLAGIIHVTHETLCLCNHAQLIAVNDAAGQKHSVIIIGTGLRKRLISI